MGDGDNEVADVLTREEQQLFAFREQSRERSRGQRGDLQAELLLPLLRRRLVVNGQKPRRDFILRQEITCKEIGTVETSLR